MQRLLLASWNNRWLLLSMTLAGVGVADIWVYVPDWVAFVLAFLSVALLVIEIRDQRKAAGEIDFAERPYDPYPDVRAAVDGNQRFDLFSYQSGSFLVDRDVTRWISRGGEAQLLAEPYSLPAELGEVARIYGRRRVRGRLDVYNGPVVGLDSNVACLPPEGGSLRFRPGRYFDHLNSDLFAGMNVTVQRRQASWYGRALFIDRRGCPRDFGDSWLLNAVGTSVVALTTDGAIVAVHQTHRNESSKGLLAPSGSGSLEPRDFHYAADGLSICDIAAAGAVREMDDEAGIGWEDLLDIRFLGFGRWLDKGGKPELLCLARLNIDSHQARRRNPRRHDVPFSKFADPLRLAPPSKWVPQKPETMLSDRADAMLSLPLRASLDLMAEALLSDDSEISDLLGTVFLT